MVAGLAFSAAMAGLGQEGEPDDGLWTHTAASGNLIRRGQSEIPFHLDGSESPLACGRGRMEGQVRGVPGQV